jgi:PLP dependent protein
VTDLAERVQAVRLRIQRACQDAGRDPASVALLPVSKRQSVAQVREAQALGLSCFGENYVQEGIGKAQACPGAEFLLLGPLQRNKARPALVHFAGILTLDRPDLALRLRLLAAELDLTRPVWIQVDLWGEASKLGGCPEAQLPALVEALGGDPRLPLRGFMAIPPPGSQVAFGQVARLRETWQDRLGRPLLLSLGMSEDLEAAVQAGSDQVRVGSALFSPRL